MHLRGPMGPCGARHSWSARVLASAVFCKHRVGDSRPAGMVAYGTVAGLALQGLRAGGSGGSSAAAAVQAAAPLPDAADKRLRLALLFAGSVMASCSGYLM